MKKTFAKTVAKFMRKNLRIFFVTADMGYDALEGLAQEFPDRFLNVGVSEANSVGISAGLALSGYKVIFYAQATFATMRCFEQVRLDVASNNLDVNIIGTSAGFALSQYGVSHYALEDVGLMRLLPNMKIFCPGDLYEVESATEFILTHKGPSYLRIGRMSGGPDVNIHKKKPVSVTGLIKIRDGKDVAIVASGSMLIKAVSVGEMLEKSGISSSVFSMPVVKPINKKNIARLKRFPLVAVMEEHYAVGGAGSAISEMLWDDHSDPKLLKLGCPDFFIHVAGSREDMLRRCGLSVGKMVSSIKFSLKKQRPNR